ncbi:hypothetical protein HY837_06690 [archaeon]|nr:hypothetical protein [archaeon]
MKYRINSGKIIVDNRKGKKNSEGYVYRNNYCSLRVSRREDLIKLFSELKKHLKHKDKLKDLNIAINNLILREHEK